MALPSPVFLDVKSTTAEISGALTAGSVATGALSATSETDTGTLNVTGNTTIGGSLTVGGNVISGGTSFRNLMVNGQIRFNQRTEGVPPGLSTNGFIADQWAFNCSSNTVLTARKNIFGTPIAPPGFINSLGGQTTVVTPAAGDFFTIIQNIEGQNLTQSLWGSISALPYTLSFWVISSATGTFGGVVMNGNKTWSYPFTYTVTAANAWQKKTITIPGPTNPSWNLVDNTVGATIAWSYGSGATFTSPAGAWINANAQGGANGQTGNSSTVAALSIGGVQFEQGISATTFEWLRVDEDLARCQRYFEKSYSQGVSPGTVTNIGAMQSRGGPGLPAAAYVNNLGAGFKVPKRLPTPAMTFYSVTTGIVNKLSDIANSADINPGTLIAGDASFFVQATNAGSVASWNFQAQWTADAGL